MMMKKLKKCVALALVSVMVMSSLCGCGGQKEASAKETKKKPVIKVGMEIAYPPFEFYEDDGKTIAGIDYDLANAIGEEIGYDMEFVPVSWDGIFAGLDKGDYDVIISAITITPERVKKYKFSTPYIQNYQCIVTMAKADKKPKSIKDLKGLKVGYQEESTSDIFLTDYIEAGEVECKVNEYNKIIDSFSDLETGRLDAMVVDSTVAEQYTADGEFEITWKQEDEPEEFGVCFPKDSEYVDIFNEALDTLKDNGELDKIIGNYF